MNSAIFLKKDLQERTARKIDRDGIVSGTADRTGIKDRSRSSVGLR